MAPYNFTTDVRLALAAARRASAALGDRRVEPRHVLLGLLTQSDAARGILRDLDVSPDELRRAVDPDVHRLPDEDPAERVPYAGASKRVLELAMRESGALQHTYVGGEHLLLALARLGERPRWWPRLRRPQPISALLARAGATHERMRSAVVRAGGSTRRA